MMDNRGFLGIEVLDHLIVNAEADYTSLKEKGYM
ncbi:JAB domain-containing protein [Fictibacillus sp. S7]